MGKVKLEIVEFKDGRYGIRRKGYGGYKFLDLESGSYWWSIGVKYFKCCKGKLAKVKKKYEELLDYGTPIKIEEE